MTGTRALAYASSALAGIAAIAAIAAAILPPVPPGQDIPPNLAAVAVMAAPEKFASFFMVGTPATGAAFEHLVLAFHPALPLFWAARAAIAVHVAMLIAGFGVAARACGASVPAATALGAAYSVGWCWAMGFMDFNIALTAVVWAIPFLFPASTTSLPGRAFASILLLAAARSHIIAAGMGLAALLTLRLARRDDGPPGRRSITLGLDVLTALPAATYATVFFFKTARLARESGRNASVESTGWDLAAAGQDLLSTTFGAFTPIGWILTVVVLCAVLAALRGVRTRSIAIVSLFWIGVMVAIPLHAAGWHFARPRLGFVALALIPALVQWRRDSRWPLVIAAAAAVVTVAGVPGAISEGRYIREAARDFGTAPSGTTLEVVFGPEPRTASAPYIRSAIGVPHYATLEGGAVAGAFATHPLAHPILFKGGMESVVPATTHLGFSVARDCMAIPECYRGDDFQADRIARTGVWWDSVAIVGAPPGVLERLEERGFVGESPALLRANPASLDIRFPSGLRGRIGWQLVYTDTIGVVFRDTGDVQQDGVGVRLDPVPAGPVDVLVWRDDDADGVPGPGEPPLLRAPGLVLTPGQERQLTIPLSRGAPDR